MSAASDPPVDPAASQSPGSPPGDTPRGASPALSPTPPLPPLTPTTRRIQAHTAAMSRRLNRSEAIGRPRIDGVIDDALLRTPPELARLGPDPADAMTRIKTGQIRDLDRPDALVDQLARITPQFTLRNTARIERFADPTWIETTTRPIRDVNFWQDVTDAARCAVERPDLAPETSSIRLAMLLAEREVVMVETRWNEVFGRPDPVE